MMEDKCSCDEHAESEAQKDYGELLSVEDMADHFALYGLQKRASALENLDSQLRGEIGSGGHSLRRYARLTGLRQKMTDVHAALRKARR